MKTVSDSFFLRRQSFLDEFFFKKRKIAFRGFTEAMAPPCEWSVAHPK
jgi:hypothetical protein